MGLIRCLILVFFLSFFNGIGQFYNLGQNPASTKWRQIKTEDFQLIFPSDFESKAQELANLISYANNQARKNLNTKPKKISIILQNNTTVDNGFVTLAPKRSEFYATPSQENEGVDWLKKLAVHEYRHVVQFEKFDEGVGKVLHLLFGEQGMGALMLLTTPLWALEGDAVDLETKKLIRGRGNYSSFLREFQAQLVELDSMSYEKVSFGSYKDRITDHYKLGYFLREAVSDSVWDKLLKRVVRNPFPPYPFSYHLKKLTGKSTSELYAQIVTEVKENYKFLNGFQDLNTVELLSPDLKDYASYYLPKLVGGNSIIALKTSYNHPARLVLIKNQEEHKIHIPGNIDANTLGFREGKLVWVEKRNDPRWNYKDYSEVILYDIDKRRRKRLKRKTRWFAPSFNPTGDSLVFLELTKDNQYRLITSDLNGNLGRRVELSSKAQYYHPNWDLEGEIVLTKYENQKNSLVYLDLAMGRLTESNPFIFPLSYPKPYKGGHVVKISKSDRDMMLFVRNDSSFVLVTPEFGLDNFDIDYDTDELIFSDYHANGSRIVKTEIEEGMLVGNQYNWFQNNLNFTVPKDSFEVKKFRPLLRLINFHSWAPLSLNPNEESANLGASLFSQNLLSSSTLQLNYDYFGYTGAQQWKARYDFEHFYPSFYAEGFHLMEPEVKVQNVNASVKTVSYQAGSYLRLNYNGSKFYKSFIGRAAYVNSNLEYDFSEVYRDTSISQENTQLFFAFVLSHKAAFRDIYSPFSVVISSSFFENLNSSQNAQRLNVASTFKGIGRNDGFRVEYGRQWGSDLFVPNYLATPRGLLSQRYKRGEVARIEYGTPIAYPDLKLSRIAFIQRIRANVFYDFLMVNDDVKTNFFSSHGGSVYFDFNPFRYSYLTTFGLQMGKSRDGQFFMLPTFYISY